MREVVDIEWCITRRLACTELSRANSTSRSIEILHLGSSAHTLRRIYSTKRLTRSVYSVSMRMIRRRHVLKGTKHLEDGLPKLTHGTRVVVRDNCHSYAMLAKHAIDKQLRCTFTINRVRHSRLFQCLAQEANKNYNPVLPSKSLERQTKIIHADGLLTPLGYRYTRHIAQLHSEEFKPLVRFARAHIRTHSLIKFGPLITLNHRVMCLLKTNMTAQRVILCLIKDLIL